MPSRSRVDLEPFRRVNRKVNRRKVPEHGVKNQVRLVHT